MQKTHQVAAAMPLQTAVCEGDKLSIHRALVTKLSVFVSYHRLRTQSRRRASHEMSREL